MPLKNHNVFENAAARGEHLQARLAEFIDHPLVGEVRGTGLIGAVEMVADKASGQAFSDARVGARMQLECQTASLWSCWMRMERLWRSMFSNTSP